MKPVETGFKSINGVISTKTDVQLRASPLSEALAIRIGRLVDACSTRPGTCVGSCSPWSFSAASFTHAQSLPPDLVQANTVTMLKPELLTENPATFVCIVLYRNWHFSVAGTQSMPLDNAKVRRRMPPERRGCRFAFCPSPASS